MQKSIFNNIYNNKKVLITGHSGFKGSWLYYWLDKIGANVKGYSLIPDTNPNHISLLYPEMEFTGDNICDLKKMTTTVHEFEPEIIFHLAAQPIVSLSYENPVKTYQTNVMGTINVLEAARKCKSVKAIVVITTDKCYENKEWVWGYRENEPMGGYDPYSSSKGCVELLVSSYRNSFFNIKNYKIKHNLLLASVRAGNVIGGGDWAIDRLIPDIVKSANKNESVDIRSPKSTRPWQHVLEPLSGYLQIGQKLLEEKDEFAEAWNFGPGDEGTITVENVLNKAKKCWDKISFNINEQKKFHEANLLKLDCSKAYMKLHWRNVWDNDKTVEKTIEWYKSFYDNQKSVITQTQIDEFINDAKKIDLDWTK